MLFKCAPELQLNADVNNHGDGMTNKDALTIQKYALQLIDTLPES